MQKARGYMSLELRNFTQDDLHYLEKWRSEIDSDKYMSRAQPMSFNGKFTCSNSDFAWYIIVSNGVDVGTVWLERKQLRKDLVILGIIIGNRNSLGKGIGKEAIIAVIKKAQPVLGFTKVRLHVRKNNTRAIACYRKCDFIVTGTGEKLMEDGRRIAFHRMEIELSGNGKFHPDSE